MENNEDSCNSLPYIDDIPTDDETNQHQYNLRIIENYHNKNRNIEITNRFPNDVAVDPVAPLADETEFSDNKLTDSAEEDGCKHMRKLTSKESGTKLVIKGWNSSISIQGLDNKSSITFKRRCEKVHKKVERSEEGVKPACDEARSADKSRKGRWKMLTRSIMLAKSARFERRGPDERYPKYVLLKNEEEEVTKVKENFPKMFVFNEKTSKQKPKPEFSFKKSFKNKTEPVVPKEEIITKTEEDQSGNEVIKKQKKPLTERNPALKKKITVERRKGLMGRPTPTEAKIAGCSLPQGQVYSEIQDIFEDTLKLLPPQGVEAQQPADAQQQPQRLEYYASRPPRFCQFSCHDPYYCPPAHGQPPKCIPLCTSHRGNVYKNTNNLTAYSYENREVTEEEQNANGGEVELGNLPFGILSSFFPRVVIMNAVPNEDMRGEVEINSAANETEFKNFQLPKPEGVKDLEEDTRATESSEVSQQDMTLKSMMIRELVKPEPVIEDFFLDDIILKEFPSLGDGQKRKSQDSEGTEYLQYTEFDPPGNESIERPNSPTPPPHHGIKEKDEGILPSATVKAHKAEDVDENSENLALTKIGYKMYDNLTKLSLNREKEITNKAEASGCGCNGNGTKKSPYNLTLESSNSVVKVTVPENELNFQILNSEGGDIQIGVMRSDKRGGKEKGEKEEKKSVRKDELWHPDNGRRALVLKNEQTRRDDNSKSKGFQKLKVSLADSQELVLSIEMNEKEKKDEKPKEKSTKEMKVGTDDFDLAGGDFVCAFGGNYKNLSPRLGQLLKHLNEKLEIDKKERKFLDDKINQKLIDQTFQTRTLPGVFLVKHISSPRTPVVKKTLEIPFGKPKKETTEAQAGGLREYYCEECLATMRIFEDENPSVKTMVDKFETIIQLESY